MAKGNKIPKKQYVKLGYAMLHSPQWQELSLAARAVYIQIKASRNLKTARGKMINRNDDHIRFGFKDCGGMSKPTYYKAIKELIDRGFIGLVNLGGIPNRKAAYALINNWKNQGGGHRVNSGGLEEWSHWD